MGTKSLKEIVEPSLDEAFSIINQSIKGLPVNEDRLKTAKFVIQTYKSARVIEKEDKKVSLTEKKFNFSVLENFGGEDQKKEIREMIQKGLTKINYIE